MKKVLFFLILVTSIQLLAQDLDGVYFKKEPKHISFSRFCIDVTPKYYVYVYLRKDSTIVYINTIGALGRGVETLRDKYVIKGDSIFFKSAFEPGILTNDKLCITWIELERAKLSDLKQFIKEHGEGLKNRNICFQDGYAVPCDTTRKW